MSSPSSSSARASRPSSRSRSSARAISSLWTESVSPSSSVLSSRSFTRTPRRVSSRAVRDVSIVLRRSDAWMTDCSRRTRTRSLAPMTALAVSASRSWRARRASALIRACRSASAASNSDDTWAARARARSSLVRSASRASVSARRPAEAFSASSSSSVVSGSSSGADSAC